MAQCRRQPIAAIDVPARGAGRTSREVRDCQLLPSSRRTHRNGVRTQGATSTTAPAQARCESANAVLIGDSIDDAYAANECGVRSPSTRGQRRSAALAHFTSLGLPTVASLDAAVTGVLAGTQHVMEATSQMYRPRRVHEANSSSPAIGWPPWWTSVHQNTVNPRRPDRSRFPGLWAYETTDRCARPRCHRTDQSERAPTASPNPGGEHRASTPTTRRPTPTQHRAPPLDRRPVIGQLSDDLLQLTGLRHLRQPRV